MEDLKINKTDLYSELEESPSAGEQSFHNWYKTKLKELRKIQKTKNLFKIIVIILSILLFVFSFFIKKSGFALHAYPLISFTLMVGIWVFTKHEAINPDKKLSIMRILYKSTKNSKIE